MALSAHGTKDIGRFGLLLLHDPRPGVPPYPDPGLGAALADAHFVQKPGIDLLQLDLIPIPRHLLLSSGVRQVQLRMHNDRIAPGIRVNLFQASQQASTICS